MRTDHGRSGMHVDIDPGLYRQVLGQYPTGVVVITAGDAQGRPIGMTVGSFTSVSLSPPLVAFLPARSSSSWAALRASGRKFCVNVLSDEQEDVCRAVAMRKTDKFDGIGWRTSSQGNPVIEGAVAWIDCTVEDVHEAGDHEIVVGRVVELGVEHSGYPLLFFRGGYGSFLPLTMAAGDADLLHQLRMVDCTRADLEALAARFETEVTVVSLVRARLVLTASVGRTRLVEAPTRVGRRVPFVPPLGGVFAAFGGESVRERWLAGIGAELPAEQAADLRQVPDRVRRRGYALNFGHELSALMEMAYTRFSDRDPAVSPADVHAAIRAVTPHTNPATYDRAALHELRAVIAPVFSPDGGVAFEINLWGPPDPVPAVVVEEYARALLDTAAAATRAIGGRAPAER
jgi:flavin reductase (DIM6/NTAB) family NADH-FMN oxidoreductase RutF